MKPIANECQFKLLYAKHQPKLKNRRTLLKTSPAATSTTKIHTKQQQ